MINSSIFDEITAVYLNGQLLFEGSEDTEMMLFGFTDDADNIKVDVFSKQYTLNQFLEFAEEVEKSDLNPEIIVAYIAGSSWDISDAVASCEEAFSGEFANDVEFAEDMAEQIGAIEKGLNWPYTCIDWERAAKELMYDYFSENGYYFRNL